MSSKYYFNKSIIILWAMFVFACSSTTSPKHATQPREKQTIQVVQQPLVQVKSGLDVLIDMGFAPFLKKRVAVVTNHTALSSTGEHLVDLLHEHPEIDLRVIYGPEHGLRGNAAAGEKVKNGIDEKTGVKVVSLYGKQRKPVDLKEMGVDLVIFDIQDIGSRFYTYISTMGLTMEACAEQGVPLFVLDRMNPISGKVNGPILNLDYKSFVGMYPIPIQHGLTIGELALMIKGENWVNSVDSLKSRIIETKGWKRHLIQSETVGDWVSPSPNMRNNNEALVYPGLCLIEGTNLSEGRGTDFPFEYMGAPFIDNELLVKELKASGLTGFTVDTVSFTPITLPGRAYKPKWENQKVKGIYTVVTDAEKFDAVSYAVTILKFVQDHYPNELTIREKGLNRLWGDDSLLKYLKGELSKEEIDNKIRQDIIKFKKEREKYIIYEV